MPDELQTFVNFWNLEAKKTADLLRTLPVDQYDFRPDPQARSLGELAWHLAEVDAYPTWSIEQGGFQPGSRPHGIERPRSIEALAPGYEQIHAEAVERIQRLSSDDLDRKISGFGGREMSIRDLLWGAVLFHMIHHRGQLSILTRIAGGSVPSIFGPTREQMAALRAAQA